MKCPACDGRCWVDSPSKGPSICPVCKGTGSIVKPAIQTSDDKGVYDQDAIWTELTNHPPVDFDVELSNAMKVLDSPAVKEAEPPYSFIVHLLFNSNVTPHGNLILDQVRRGQLQTGSAQERLSEDHLRARGYSLVSDGKVQTVKDIPVGPIYNVLVEWLVDGLADWNMATDPVAIDVNRKGNPLFMDNNMVAFCATYKDLSMVRESLEALNKYCGGGVRDDLKPVGRIVKLRLFYLSKGI